MLIPEWLLKVFSLIRTTETAFKAILTIILATTSWRTTYAYLISKGVPTTLALLFILIVAYGLSYLIVDLVVYCKDRFVHWCQNKSDIANQKHELELFKAKASTTIPNLPSKQIEILRELHEEGYIQCHRYKDGIPNLNKLKYIYEVNLVNEKDYLFAINPNVFEVVDSYFKKQRDALLFRFCEELTDNDIEFLRIFFDDKIPFGTPETEAMPGLVWRSGAEMIRKGVLKRHDNKGSQRQSTHIVLELVADTEKKLHELKGFSSYRQKAELDLSLLLVGGENRGP